MVIVYRYYHLLNCGFKTTGRDITNILLCYKLLWCRMAMPCDYQTICFVRWRARTLCKTVMRLCHTLSRQPDQSKAHVAQDIWYDDFASCRML
jgi:hypothetical protein